MKFPLRRSLCLLLALCLSLSLVPAVQGAEAEARDISSRELVTDHSGIHSVNALFDGKTTRRTTANPGAELTVQYSEGMGSAYLIFDAPSGGYTVTDNTTGTCLTFGEAGWLHDFLDLEAAFGTCPTSLTIRFDQGAKLNELYFFTAGDTPDFVQKWEAPKENATDLMLFSTHCDDDQLFFAGMLPYYAAELDYEVLVVYLTCHQKKEPWRQHEMLNGLYAVGVRTYPIMGTFSDYFSTTMDYAYKVHKVFQESDEALLGYVVEQLRRYKPLVAVGHDLLNGEYGHGQHMMYADLLCRALDTAADPAQYPELAKQYGTWDVPKTYLHLWPENTVTMDWDVPLESFDGMTAFQVTQQLGYPCHASQYQDFAWYLTYANSSTDVQKYPPYAFGLYRSLVGADVQKNDFFENLTPYHIRQIQSLLEDTAQTDFVSCLEDVMKKTALKTG